MTRAEHLAWAKGRALVYVEQGDLIAAYTSRRSDLNKHPETVGHVAWRLGDQLLTGGHLASANQMRHFIEGFN